jgi:hypothetical protein
MNYETLIAECIKKIEESEKDLPLPCLMTRECEMAGGCWICSEVPAEKSPVELPNSFDLFPGTIQ